MAMREVFTEIRRQRHEEGDIRKKETPVVGLLCAMRLTTSFAPEVPSAVGFASLTFTCDTSIPRLHEGDGWGNAMKSTNSPRENSRLRFINPLVRLFPMKILR